MKLLPLLCQIESNNNYLAVGDDGKAVGILQIHQCVIDDVNRLYNTDFTSADRKYVGASKLIATLYLGFWGRRYYLEMGKEPTMEVYARIWNSGPRGWEKVCSVPYWKKVEELIK